LNLALERVTMPTLYVAARKTLADDQTIGGAAGADRASRRLEKRVAASGKNGNWPPAREMSQ
jgi:hypothetical protein